MNVRALRAAPSSSKAGVIDRGTKVKYPRVSLSGVLTNSTLAFLGILFLLPLAWLITTSFDAKANGTLRFPDWTFQHYRDVFTGPQLHPFWISFYLAGLSTVISTVVSTFMAYALSRRRIPGKRTFLLAILFMGGLPILMLLIPVYQMYASLGWLNSMFYTSVFIAATSVPFSVWLLWNFIEQVPREFEEAAAVEGAGQLVVLTRIVLPLAAPGILATSMIAFIATWGAFLVPLILDSNPNDVPVALYIYRYLGTNGQTQYGNVAAYSMLFALPVIALYFIVSRYIVGAFTLAGGVKS